MKSKVIKASDIVIFCDFDGTITKNDTVDHFLTIFADKNWLNIEEAWKNGEIGSKECLTKQLECVDFITWNQYNNFTDSIEIDDYFGSFVKILNQKKVDIYIVSDGFDFFISKTLQKYKLADSITEVFSNKLNFIKGNLIPDFSYHNPECKKKSGLCKCEVIKKLKTEKKVLYIGDGTSDICASEIADILFAKNSLAEHCSDNGINHVKFESFKDICEYLYLNLGEDTDVKNEILV